MEQSEGTDENLLDQVELTVSDRWSEGMSTADMREASDVLKLLANGERERGGGEKEGERGGKE